MYVGGMSSSLPEDVQVKMYRTLEGLENVELLRTVFKNGNNITKEEERILMDNAESMEEKDFYQLVFNFFLKERAKKVIMEE